MVISGGLKLFEQQHGQKDGQVITPDSGGSYERGYVEVIQGNAGAEGMVEKEYALANYTARSALGAGFGLLTIHNDSLLEYQNLMPGQPPSVFYYKADHSNWGLYLATWIISPLVFVLASLLVVTTGRPDELRPEPMSGYSPV